MFYVLNPITNWVKISKSRYSLSLGVRLLEVSGDSVDFIFERFLPYFKELRDRNGIFKEFKNDVKFVEQAITACTSIGLLLTKIEPISPNLYDGLRANIVPDTKLETHDKIKQKTLYIFGNSLYANQLEKSLDIPIKIEFFDNIDNLIESKIKYQDKKIGSEEFNLEDTWPNYITIVFDTNSHALELSQINLKFLKSDIWWIPVRLSPTHTTVGPLIIPFQTPCFECLVIRHCSTSPMSEILHKIELDSSLKRDNNSNLVSKALLSQAIGVLSSELLLYFTPPCFPGIIGRIISFSHFSMGTKYNRVLRLPNCPACKDSSVSKHPWEKISLTVNQVMGYGR